MNVSWEGVGVWLPEAVRVVVMKFYLFRKTACKWQFAGMILHHSLNSI